MFSVEAPENMSFWLSSLSYIYIYRILSVVLDCWIVFISALLSRPGVENWLGNWIQVCCLTSPIWDFRRVVLGRPQSFQLSGPRWVETKQTSMAEEFKRSWEQAYHMDIIKAFHMDTILERTKPSAKRSGTRPTQPNARVASYSFLRTWCDAPKRETPWTS